MCRFLFEYCSMLFKRLEYVAILLYSKLPCHIYYIYIYVFLSLGKRKKYIYKCVCILIYTSIYIHIHDREIHITTFGNKFGKMVMERGLNFHIFQSQNSKCCQNNHIFAIQRVKISFCQAFPLCPSLSYTNGISMYLKSNHPVSKSNIYTIFPKDFSNDPETSLTHN